MKKAKKSEKAEKVIADKTHFYKLRAEMWEKVSEATRHDLMTSAADSVMHASAISNISGSGVYIQAYSGAEAEFDGVEVMHDGVLCNLTLALPLMTLDEINALLEAVTPFLPQGFTLPDFVPTEAELAAGFGDGNNGHRAEA